MNEPVSGAYALARGAIEAGVSLVTGYPGAPATAVVNNILELTSPDEVQTLGVGARPAKFFRAWYNAKQVSLLRRHSFCMAQLCMRRMAGI